jgi:hypothetical protein
MKKPQSLAQKAKNREKHLKTLVKEENNIPSQLVAYRPSVYGTRKCRNNKNEVYKRTSDILYKYGIKGNYVGLAAAHAPDIYEVLSPQAQGKIVNCEKNKDSANKLIYYTGLANQFYKDKFSLYEGDIFQYMNETDNVFSIIDLDLMEMLGSAWTEDIVHINKINRIVNSVQKSSSNKFLLMIWSTIGMKVITRDQYDEKVRPAILKAIGKPFRILKHVPFRYCDNSIPIRVELLVAQKRRKK